MHGTIDDIVSEPDSWPLDPRECRQLRKLKRKFPPVAIDLGQKMSAMGHRSTFDQCPAKPREASCMTDSSELDMEPQE